VFVVVFGNLSVFIIIGVIIIIVVSNENIAIVGEVDLTWLGVGRLGVAAEEAGGLMAVSRSSRRAFACVPPSNARSGICNESSGTRYDGRCEGQWFVASVNVGAISSFIVEISSCSGIVTKVVISPKSG